MPQDWKEKQSMNEHDINKKLLSGIEISDDMKSDLLNNVKNGKRTSDKRFKYATPLTALCLSAVILFGGASAGVIYMNYKNRLENMPAEEKNDYYEEYKNDIYDTSEEAETRELSESEKLRIAALEKDYYNNSVFPENTLPFVEDSSELTSDMLAFVKKDNKLHLPAAELSDEQILQYIDYQAKYNYVIDELAGTDNYDAKAEEAKLIKFDVEASDAESLKAQSKEIIEKFYGEEVDDSWNCDVSGNNFSDLVEFDEAWDGYTVNWTETDAPNAKFFQIQIPKNEGGVFIITRGGLEVFAGAKKYSKEEAQEFIPTGQKIVEDFVCKKFAIGFPDYVVVRGFEDAGGDPIESECVLYELYYGDEYISVEWMITGECVNGITGKALDGLIK